MPELSKRSDWPRYRFDDMAVIVNDRIDDPSTADVEFYLGLEHLDSNSLKIRRWGSPSDVEATKLRFKAGDIIFGRRRVYQRKLAVADFPGICSAHAMVLRAKPEVAQAEFLPFFMQSDLFMERALEISVGSLSPTINWKTLAKEEFVLPPHDQQRRITKVMVAAEQTKEALREVHLSGQVALDSISTHLLRQAALEYIRANVVPHVPPGWKVTAFEDVTERITYGFTNPMPTTDEGPWMITGTDIRDGQIDYATGRHTSRRAFDEDITEKSRARIGDVLLTKDGTLGRVAIVDQPDTCVNQSVAVLRPSESVLSAFLAWTLRAPLMQRRLMLDVSGSAVQHIYITKLAKTRFLLPPVAVQRKMVRILDNTEAMVLSARERERRCAQTARRILQIAMEGCQ